MSESKTTHHLGLFGQSFPAIVRRVLRDYHRQQRRERWRSQIIAYHGWNRAGDARPTLQFWHNTIHEHFFSICQPQNGWRAMCCKAKRKSVYAVGHARRWHLARNSCVKLMRIFTTLAVESQVYSSQTHQSFKIQTIASCDADMVSGRPCCSYGGAT